METHSLPFTMEEYRSRLERIRTELRRRGLAGLLVCSPHNIYWLTGFRTGVYSNLQPVIVPESGEPVMVSFDLERNNIRRLSWIENYHLYGLEDAQSEPVRFLIDAVREMGLARERLGIEMQANYLTAYEFEHLKAALSGTQFEDATDIIHGFRMVKSPKELEYIQEAARLSSLGMRTAIEAVRPGLKEYEVAGPIYNAMVSAGSDYFGPIYLLSGERTHALHDTWRDREIQANDHVYVELSGNCQRYVATFMRTMAIGNPDPSVERMAEGSIAALDAAEREFRPGMTSHEAAGVLKRAYRSATNLDLPYGLLGYSLGISFPPGFGEWQVFAIAEGDERELREDMCLHLTPVNTIEGVGTVGLSEPVQVTKDGIKCLASVERQLWKL